MKLVCERFRIRYRLKFHGHTCKFTRVEYDLDDLKDFIDNLVIEDDYISHEVVKEKIYEEPFS